MLSGRRIVLGITGGIAAYKAAELARQLVQAGCEVTAVMTRNARRFVGPLTLRTLTGRPVASRLFSDPATPLPHISLARWADLVLVAPATADALARTAQGRANDLLSAVILDTAAPVLWAPAMNSRMWQHPLTQDNVRRLTAAGHHMVPPAAGELACGEEGEGRLAALPDILAAVRTLLVPSGPLAGKRVLITAGPTHEPWDAVRYLSNRSSGRMGYALAAEAQRRGAQVTLISGPVALPAPPGVERISVTTALDMHAQTMSRFSQAEIVIAAAAVADFRPAAPAKHKIKKTEMPKALELEANPDILAEMGRTKTTQFLVGFAAESAGDLAQAGLEKLRAKHLDLIVANRAGGADDAFDAEASAAVLVDAAGSRVDLIRQPKTELASAILTRVVELLSQNPALK
jgi:phosphopantothenoylcysteine decarboxylase / phosphopantothenate---cysteine ligase